MKKITPLGGKESRLLNQSLVINVAIVVMANMAYVLRQMVKWLEPRVRAPHRQGKLWERCRNTKGAYSRETYQSYGVEAWGCLPVLRNRD